ncbi:Tyrosine recombinase XerC [Sulfitobacter sp. DSM 110093]|nr:tyrosine-type recombinase/integrase [Sulfitobacter sp. DSM 110093]UOA32180.1 Tyrosine recombinase XerC [Sulfitobacter sp. DSM 110093]
MAERRVLSVVASWKVRLEAARTGKPEPSVDLAQVALDWREALDAAPDTDTRDRYELILSDKADKAEEKREGAGVELFKVATRQWLETGEMVEDWLQTLDNEPKTIDMKRSDLKRFSERFRLTLHVERKAVQRWVDHLRSQEHLKLPTIRRIISACRGYWSYLQRLDYVPDDAEPFRDVVPRPAKKSKRDIAERRQPFSDSDVVRLLNASVAQKDENLARLIWFGMWTGCRIEELCALRVTDVSLDRFQINDAKSEAGWREVPIHSTLAPALERMCAESTDGYVLSGLTENKYQDRSNAVGKRFGRLKTRLGFGSSHVFHSIRKTVTTQLDAAGIPEAVSARIVGHDIPTLTYGVYSGGAPFEVKRDAIMVLSYPLQELDQPASFGST